jgi:dihydrolipoamide dehydrogenase
MSDFDLIVIGGGEAGLLAALRGAELGAKAALIDKGHALGGGCVQTGTLPSKILSNAAHFLEGLKAAKRYGVAVDSGLKASLKEIQVSRHKTVMCEVGILATHIRTHGVKVLNGEASFRPDGAVAVRDLDGAERIVRAPRVVVATGSEPFALPGIPFDGRNILSSDDVAALETLPARLLIVGAGVNGCEYAFIFRTLGAEVVLAEMLDRPLWNQDKDVSALIARELKKRGIRFLPGAKVERVEEAGDGTARAVVAGADPVLVDKVIVVAGRRPRTAPLNLDAVGVRTGSRGEIVVNDRMETSRPGVYAAGDVLAGFMLSSTAMMEARVAVENALGQDVRADYASVPWGIYTDPEVGAVGLTEDEAARRSLPVVIGTCGYNDLVRACLDGNVTGLVKLLFDAETQRLVGAHIVGQDAAEIIHVAALAVRTGAKASDLRDQVFNHPTICEAFAKAASAALKKF